MLNYHYVKKVLPVMNYRQKKNLEHFDEVLYCDPYHFQVEPSKLVFLICMPRICISQNLKKSLEKKLSYLKRETFIISNRKKTAGRTGPLPFII